MTESIWTSRPADLYGRRKRDRSYTALWSVGTLFGGFASASRWTPSRISPVQRTITASVIRREPLTPDVVALTLADPDGGLLPSWTPGAHNRRCTSSSRACSTRGGRGLRCQVLWDRS